MKKFGTRVGLIIATALIFLTTSISATLVFVPDASAAPAPPDPAPSTPSIFYAKDLDLASQAQLWESWKMVSSNKCALRSGLSLDEIKKGNWFNDYDYPVGHQMEPDDGNLKCSNENGWFSNLLDTMGFSGDYVTPSTIVFGPASGNHFTDGSDLPKFQALVADKLFGVSVAGVPTVAPKALQWYILYNNFIATKACSAGVAPTDVNSQRPLTANIWVYDQASGAAVQKLYDYGDKDGNGKDSIITLGYGIDWPGADDSTLTCGVIANALGNRDYADAVVSYIATNPGAGIDNPTNNPDATDPNLDCSFASLNPLDWFICPIIKGLGGILNQLDSAISNLLTIDQTSIFDQTKNGQVNQTGVGYYTAWKTFRGFALAVLVIAALAMIISQALGFDFLDAYTIKKIMPRLIFAIIGIALSWEIMKFFVILTNDLGNGIRQIIYYPFKGMNGNISLTLGSEFLAGLIAGGAIAALGIMGVLSFIATAALAVGVAFLVLILRQLVVVFLILLAPVAIACSVLPNTQHVYKLWYESFSKAMMMFPIIVAFLSLGRVFAVSSVGGNATNAPALNQLIAYAAYILPYFLIPLTFRFAGGALRTIGGAVNDRNRGAFDRLKKYRHGQYQEHGGRMMHNASNRVLEKRAEVSDNLLRSASKDTGATTRTGRVAGWARRRALTGVAGAVGDYNIEAKMSAARAAKMKEVNDQIASGRDEEVRALTVDKKTSAFRVNPENGSRQFRTLGGAWMDEAYVDRAQKRWGRDTFAQQAALSYEMRKASSEEELDHLAKNYHNVAQGAWGMSDGQAAGAWVGAAFENQGANLQFKKTRWQDGTMSASGQKDFVNEIYEKKGSYPLAQMNSATIKALEDSYVAAESSGDTETMQKVRAISETFVSRYGGGGGGGFDTSDPAQAAQAAAQQAAAAGPVVVQSGSAAAGRGPRIAGRRSREGQPTAVAGGPLQGNVTTNAAGSAHVAERVNQLARRTGVYQDRDPAPRSGPGGSSFPDIPYQN